MVTDILIGTDSNCSEKSSARRQQAFSRFCEEYSFTTHRSSVSTFHHSNGTSDSNIDLFLISSKSKMTLKNLVTSCTLDNALNFSAHDVVSAKIEIPITEEDDSRDIFSTTYSKFDQKHIIWDTDKLKIYQQVAENFLSKCESAFPNPECIPLKCSLFSELLVRAAELCLETKPSGKKIEKSNVSKKMNQAWKLLEGRFNNWKRNGKTKNESNKAYQKYKAARASFQQTRRAEFNHKFIRSNNFIMHAGREDKDMLYKLMKKIRGETLQSITNKLVTPSGTYHNSDVLEGFAADAELLGKYVGECEEFDNNFYHLCIADNQYIFEFKGDNYVKIPQMKIADLNKIIFKDMKPGKACDIYMLTVEHLRHAGDNARLHILNLMNDLINDIYYLTCPQVKKGLSSVIFKGKLKSKTISSSYRRITVTPQLGGILDRYIDPVAEDLFRHVQSPDQFGFTKDISYLMGAVERGECQRWALDHKLTCYRVSFDGHAAFPSVDREIHVRELYTVHR